MTFFGEGGNKICTPPEMKSNDQFFLLCLITPVTDERDQYTSNIILLSCHGTSPQKYHHLF